MKTAQSVLQQTYKQMTPPFSPGDIVTGVMDKGLLRTLPPQPWDGVTCPMCKSNLGYRVRNLGTNIWACRHSDCIQRNAKKPIITPTKQNIHDVLERSGVPPIFRKTINEPWKHPQALKNDLEQWASNPKGFLLLSGPPGCGKTHAAVYAMASFMNFKGVPARFYDAVELRQLWMDEMRTTGLKTLSYKLTECELLVIDDLGQVSPSDSFYELLYLIINSRYKNEKPTIITTNTSPNDMVNQLGDALTSRILSKEGLCVNMQGSDLRI